MSPAKKEIGGEKAMKQRYFIIANEMKHENNICIYLDHSEKCKYIFLRIKKKKNIKFINLFIDFKMIEVGCQNRTTFLFSIFFFFKKVSSNKCTN